VVVGAKHFNLFGVRIYTAPQGTVYSSNRRMSLSTTNWCRCPFTCLSLNLIYLYLSNDDCEISYYTFYKVTPVGTSVTVGVAFLLKETGTIQVKPTSLT